MTNREIIYQKIDKIIENIDLQVNEPAFSVEVEERNSRKAPETLTDEKLLEIFTMLIAYSGQAPSDKVKLLIEAKIFDELFESFNVSKVAILNPCELVDVYWDRISPIRYKTKVFQIVMFARSIRKIGSLSALLTQSEIPIRLNSNDDIDKFWEGFNKLQNELKLHKVSYLNSTTTLLHYLLDTGYDCVKPDSVVMRVAKKIGIVDNENGDKNFRNTVKFLQEYSIDRNLRPSIVDLYFLIDEGQKEAKKFVNEDYYKALPMH